MSTAFDGGLRVEDSRHRTVARSSFGGARSVDVEAWGYPTSSFVAPSGRPVYVYQYSQSYLTPTYTTSFGGISRSIFGGYDTSMTSVSSGGQLVTHYCKTFFEVGGARRKIVKVSFEGDSCRSL